MKFDFDQPKKYYLILFVLLLVSAILNLVQLYFSKNFIQLTRKIQQITVIRSECDRKKQDRFSKNDQNAKHLFAVYVKPHLPSFLDVSYEIYFNYRIKEIEGRKKVIFMEKDEIGFTEKEVDAEAIV